MQDEDTNKILKLFKQYTEKRLLLTINRFDCRNAGIMKD